jgi:hypothetical protein
LKASFNVAGSSAIADTTKEIKIREEISFMIRTI